MHVFKVPSRFRSDSESNLSQVNSDVAKSGDDLKVGSVKSDSTTSAAAVYNQSQGFGWVSTSHNTSHEEE